MIATAPHGRFLRWWTGVMKRRINPGAMEHAGEPGSRFTIVRAVGRKSGAVHETPIITARAKGGRMVELTYGPGVQWYRNARAAGECELVVDGRTLRIVGFDEVDPATGRRAFPVPERWVLALLRRKHFVLFRTG